MSQVMDSFPIQIIWVILVGIYRMPHDYEYATYRENGLNIADCASTFHFDC